MTAEPAQSIQTFLEQLKLADKYSELFIKNGYITVGDCNGINEETLKCIGVTLPGWLELIFLYCTKYKLPSYKTLLYDGRPYFHNRFLLQNFVFIHLLSQQQAIDRFMFWET